MRTITTHTSNYTLFFGTLSLDTSAKRSTRRNNTVIANFAFNFSSYSQRFSMNARRSIFIVTLF